MSEGRQGVDLSFTAAQSLIYKCKAACELLCDFFCGAVTAVVDGKVSLAKLKRVGFTFVFFRKTSYRSTLRPCVCVCVCVRAGSSAKSRKGKSG